MQGNWLSFGSGSMEPIGLCKLQQRPPKGSVMRVYCLFFFCGLVGAFHGLYGESWTAPVALSPSGVDAHSPKLSLNEAGQTVAAWITGQDVKVATSSFGGSWSTTASLRSALYEICTDPRVYINASGQMLAVWGGGFVFPPYAA